ncbi:MAG TPA: winged helix-turn-helix domain-containing protein [Candidatus Limnocylindrales bacterium]
MSPARIATNSPTRPVGLVRPGLTSVPLPSVEMDPRTAYELLASTCSDCGELDDLLPEDRRWLEDSRAALTAQLGSNPSFKSCSGFMPELGRILAGRPEVKTARDVVAAIDKMSDADLLEAMVGELLEDPDLSGITRRAVDGEAAAYAELQARLDSSHGHSILTTPLADLIPAARAILHAWLPRFEVVEARVGRMLDRDAASRGLDDAVRDPIGFVERTTNGIRLVPEQRIRRVILAPSYFGRPYNSLTKVGDAQIICYPIGDSALGAADRLAPPASTIRLYRALGDESRLRILRLLAEGDRYLTEIANELDLSKPTIKHHLAQLRAAGLVTLIEQSNLTYYSLRRDRAEEAGVELRAYLAH